MCGDAFLTCKMERLYLSASNSMSTNYDLIAEQYKRSKVTPWRTYIEQYTLLELLGDVRGKSILDLACGEGYYSRIFKRQGASRVLGVDLSSKMIDLARASERESQLGVEYVVGDATNFRAGGNVRHRGRCLPAQLCGHPGEAARDVSNRESISAARRALCNRQ